MNRLLRPLALFVLAGCGGGGGVTAEAQPRPETFAAQGIALRSEETMNLAITLGRFGDGEGGVSVRVETGRFHLRGRERIRSLENTDGTYRWRSDLGPNLRDVRFEARREGDALAGKMLWNGATYPFRLTRRRPRQARSFTVAPGVYHFPTESGNFRADVKWMVTGLHQNPNGFGEETYATLIWIYGPDYGSTFTWAGTEMDQEGGAMEIGNASEYYTVTADAGYGFAEYYQWQTPSVTYPEGCWSDEGGISGQISNYSTTDLTTYGRFDLDTINAPDGTVIEMIYDPARTSTLLGFQFVGTPTDFVDSNGTSLPWNVVNGTYYVNTYGAAGNGSGVAVIGARGVNESPSLSLALGY